MPVNDDSKLELIGIENSYASWASGEGIKDWVETVFSSESVFVPVFADICLIKRTSIGGVSEVLLIYNWNLI